ncbi:RNA-binding S4 domain-containing protein [Kaarinaea lacus]
MEKIRLDKWLWAARFFKTRSLAVTAIKGGKVSINGQHAKPGKDVCIGDSLTVRQGHELRTVVVQGLSPRRGPAQEAQLLYDETAESMERRQKEKTLRQLSQAQRPRGEGRPTKRQRRQIHRFTRSS